MSRSLARDIAAYDAMVDALPSYTEDEEVAAVLVWRETLQERLDRGESITEESVALLDRSDVVLRRLLLSLSRRFPEVFALDPSPPERLWWWHPESAATSAA